MLKLRRPKVSHTTLIKCSELAQLFVHRWWDTKSYRQDLLHIASKFHFQSWDYLEITLNNKYHQEDMWFNDKVYNIRCFTLGLRSSNFTIIRKQTSRKATWTILEAKKNIQIISYLKYNFRSKPADSHPRVLMINLQKKSAKYENSLASTS